MEDRAEDAAERLCGAVSLGWLDWRELSCLCYSARCQRC